MFFPKKSLLPVILFIAAALVLAACGGGGGGGGKPGGPSTVTAQTTIPEGDICSSGGVKLDYGIDDNRNGKLDAAEVDGSEYICNGADGSSTLVNVTEEPAGANCAAGGYKVESGLDADSDGALDAVEVTSTSYLCNGASGAAGAKGLVNVTIDSTQCAEGGYKVESGMDADADGVLDASEVSSTSYICNGTDGADGASALVNVTPEPAGTNCEAGGLRVESGLDTNNDGTMDTLLSTSYVCNGAYASALLANAVSPIQIDLSWPTLAGDAPVAEYDVYMNGYRLAWTTSTSYSVTDLTPSVMYCFVVIGLDADLGFLLQSDEVCAVTDYDEPRDGNNGFSTATATSVPATVEHFITNSPAPDDRDYYAFTLGADAGIEVDLSGLFDNLDVFLYTASEEEVGRSTNPGTDPESIVYTAPAGDYYLLVQGAASYAQSPYTLLINTTVLPGEPTGVEAVAASHDQVDLSWDASVAGDYPIVEYNIYEGADGPLLASTTSTTFSFSGLEPETTYCYTVSADDSGGFLSPRSVEACATTGPDPYAAPASLTATAADYRFENGASEGAGIFAAGRYWGTGLNSFVAFDLSGVSGGVNSAALIIHQPLDWYSLDTSETLSIWDVSASLAELMDWSIANTTIYADLESGSSYGNFTVTQASTDPVVVMLNNSALANINAAVGGTFSMGFHMESAATGDEYVVAYANAFELQLNPAPDLTVSVDSVSSDGSSFTVSYTVANNGLVDAGAFAVDVWADSASPPAVGDVGDAYNSHAGLAAEASLSSSVTIAGTQSTVTSYAVVDGADAVDEMDETNNVSAPAVWPAPDLTVAVNSVSKDSTTGYITVYYTVANNSTVAAGAFYVDAWANLAVPPSVGDTGAYATHAGLAAGASVSGSIIVPGSSGTSGFAYAIVDTDNAVQEADETNNISFFYAWTCLGTYNPITGTTTYFCMAAF